LKYRDASEKWHFLLFFLNKILVAAEHTQKGLNIGSYSHKLQDWSAKKTLVLEVV
jgi:hypothetical protein